MCGWVGGGGSFVCVCVWSFFLFSFSRLRVLSRDVFALPLVSRQPRLLVGVAHVAAPRNNEKFEQARSTRPSRPSLSCRP